MRLTLHKTKKNQDQMLGFLVRYNAEFKKKNLFSLVFILHFKYNIM